VNAKTHAASRRPDPSTRPTPSWIGACFNRPRRQRAGARLRSISRGTTPGALALAGGVHWAFICAQIVRVGSGGSQVAEAAHEGSLVNFHGCGGARGWQRLGDHEQRLQEQPSRMVRSSLRSPAPREDETQLTNRAPGASPPMSPSCRSCCSISIRATPPASGSNLTFESEAGFPPDWSHASLAHANRYLHHSQAR
jgi:hypothetical protein